MPLSFLFVDFFDKSCTWKSLPTWKVSDSGMHSQLKRLYEDLSLWHYFPGSVLDILWNILDHSALNNSSRKAFETCVRLMGRGRWSRKTIQRLIKLFALVNYLVVLILSKIQSCWHIFWFNYYFIDFNSTTKKNQIFLKIWIYSTFFIVSYTLN